MEAAAKIAEIATLKRDLKKEQRHLIMRRIFSNHLVMTGLAALAILLLLVMIGPLVSSYDPYETVVEERLLGPSSVHWLGTDNLGRDLFARIAYGAQVSMSVGFWVAIIASALGLIIGLYSSYYRVLDNVLMRICDGLMCFPAILLAMALMAALGPGTKNVIMALSLVYIPYVARVVRSSALVVREETYIEAIRAQGASSLRIIWGHIVPNILSPLIVQATFIFANAIIVEAALSFLGVGVPAPEPSWGNILYDGKIVIFTSWWVVVFPGICIILSVLGLNLFGDGLRDILDPHTD